MNYKVLSYFCCYFSVLFFVAGLFGDIDETSKIVIAIIGFLFLFLSYVLNRIEKRLSVKIDEYGFLYNKFIDIDDVPVFRDVPCNGDIYYAYELIKLNNFKLDNINIIGAILLKFVKEKKINVKKINSKYVIDLTKKVEFLDSFELEFFNMIYEASENGILEIDEFSKWAKNYDIRFLGLFIRKETEIINLLKKEMHIYHRVTEDECFYQYVMDDKIYNDSMELYGFKKFLEDFTLMEDKEVKDLYLWKDYMIFATLFGISNKVSKQLKDIYPNIEDIDLFDLM